MTSVFETKGFATQGLFYFSGKHETTAYLAAGTECFGAILKDIIFSFRSSKSNIFNTPETITFLFHHGRCVHSATELKQFDLFSLELRQFLFIFNIF
jgi:hypothetical protein